MSRVYQFLRETQKLVVSDFKTEVSLAFNKSSSNILRQGYLREDNFLNPDLCDELRDKIIDHINTENISQSVRKSNDGKQEYDTGMIDLPDIDSFIPNLKSKINVQTIIGLLENEIGKQVNLVQVSSYINRGVENTRCFHLDSIGSGQYKAFIYLTDVPDNTYGPYSFVEGSHRFSPYRYVNLINNFLNGYPMKDMRIYNPEKERVFTAKKGTLLISSQDGMHRGQPQLDGRTRVLVVLKFLVN